MGALFAVFGLSALCGYAETKRQNPARVEPSSMPPTTLATERIVVGIAMPPTSPSKAAEGHITVLDA